MKAQTIPTTQELYDSLPERAERIPKTDRIRIFSPLAYNQEKAEEIYRNVVSSRKLEQEYKRKIGKKRDTLQEILRQEYSGGMGGDKNELIAEDFQLECKPVHALKYMMKYYYSLNESIQYARESKLGKREFRAAIRSLISDQQRIHDYVEKSNAEFGGEEKVTLDNSCLRNTEIMNYNITRMCARGDEGERALKAIHYIQFEYHKVRLQWAKKLAQELEELERSKK